MRPSPPPVISFIGTEEQDRPLVLARYPEVMFLPSDLRGDALAEACAHAAVISTCADAPFPRSVVERLPALRLLCTRSVGFDHIDLAACAGRGVTVCNVPDYGSHIIAEFAFALLLSGVRRIADGRQRVAGGSFDHRGLRGMALKGRTIGIVGTGRIGSHAARIAAGFGENPGPRCLSPTGTGSRDRPALRPLRRPAPPE